MFDHVHKSSHKYLSRRYIVRGSSEGNPILVELDALNAMDAIASVTRNNPHFKVTSVQVQKGNQDE